MIVVLTSNYNGGIFQFACQVLATFKNIVKDAVLFAPQECSSADESVVLYDRINSVMPMNCLYSDIADQILMKNPALVFVCDSNLVTSRIVIALRKRVPVVMCVHDVVQHPYYNAIALKIKDFIKRPYIMRAWRASRRIVVLSENSKRFFVEKHKCFAEKTVLMRLGAHVPHAIATKPDEVIETPYILFFGRIDKYKGLKRLLKAYQMKYNCISLPLVIAGSGTLTEEEKRLISQMSDKILLIQRYIEDGEMCWLFEHSVCVVLPYIEASQSGVLSMAYSFGKPVIVSNLDGLKEYVIEGKTGYVFSDECELSELLVSMMSDTDTSMRDTIDEYMSDNLNWENNIKNVCGEYIESCC